MSPTKLIDPFDPRLFTQILNYSMQNSFENLLKTIYASNLHILNRTVMHDRAVKVIFRLYFEVKTRLTMIFK